MKRNHPDMDADIAIALFDFEKSSYREKHMQTRRWTLHRPGTAYFTMTGAMDVEWGPALPGELPFADALRDVPLYTTLPEDAWLAIDRLMTIGWVVDLSGWKGTWDVALRDTDGGDVVSVSRRAMPEALGLCIKDLIRSERVLDPAPRISG